MLQIDYWKEQAGLPPHKREYVDLEEIADSKQNGALPACLGQGMCSQCLTFECPGLPSWLPHLPCRPRRRLGVSRAVKAAAAAALRTVLCEMSSLAALAPWP